MFYLLCVMVYILFVKTYILYYILLFLYHQNSAFLLTLSLILIIALRKEFELDSRYHALSLKVNIVNEDAR